MSLYSYKVKDPQNKIYEDVLQANSKKEAVTMLKSDKLQVLTIKEMDAKGSRVLKGSVSTSEKAAFCRFMATMLKAGLPLLEAIDILRQETQSKKLKAILFDITFYVRKGSSLSDVIGKYEDEFGPVFITMIKAGEESGTLEKSFDYMAKQLLASYELTQKIKSAMMYPAVIIFAMVGVGLVMLVFVLPKLSSVFLSLDVKLPPVTRFVMNLGNSIGENLALTLITFFGLIFLTFMLFVIRRTRRFIFYYFVKLPVIKKVMEQIDVARFARTLSTLLKSGVPIMAALDVSSKVLAQPQLQKQAIEFSGGVSKGKSLSEILTDGKKQLFPVTMVQTIKAGEKTGSLELVLEELAGFYEMEVDYSLKRATALLEPLFMLLIGIAVGAMVVIMITPIYSIVGGLDGSL